MSDYRIVEDDLDGPEVAALLALHLARCTAVARVQSPRDAARAAAPARRDVLFGVGRRHARRGRRAQGARAATRRAQVDARRPEYRGKGAGKAILEHLIGRGARRGYPGSGSRPAARTVRPGRALYASYGFVDCEDFGDYVVDEWSVCMSRALVTVLRRAGLADVPVLAPFAAQAFTAAFGHLYRPEDLALFLGEWRTKKAYRDALAIPARRIQLAEVDGRLGGYAVIALGEGFEERPQPHPARPVLLSQLYCAAGMTGARLSVPR
jgi:GNAT superfamily N-acetyltransferase